MTKPKQYPKGIRYKATLKKYEARISINGQALSKTFQTELEAVTWHKLQTESRKTECHFTCYELFPKWLEHLKNDKSIQTVYKYERDTRVHIEPFFKHKKIKDVDDKFLKEFVIQLKQRKYCGNTITFKTARNIIGTLWSFFEYCCEHTYLESNPVHSDSFSDYRRRFLGSRNQKSNAVQHVHSRTRSEDEIKSLIKASYQKGYEFGFGVEFLVGTGMRLGEIASLTWSDITRRTYRNGFKFYCTINKTRDHRTREIQRSAKSGSNRIIALDDMLSSKLLTWKQMAQEYGYDVGNNNMTFPLIARNQKLYSAHVGELSNRIGIRHTTAHCLRHSMGTYLAINNHNLQEVAKYLGHTTEKTTRVYFDPRYLGTETMAKTAEGMLIPTEKLGFCEESVLILQKNT